MFCTFGLTVHIEVPSNGLTNINNHALPTVKKSETTIESQKKFCQMHQICYQSDNLIGCHYYDIPEFKEMKITEQQDLSILHSNIFSISAHINDLRNFLNLVNQKIDIICI